MIPSLLVSAESVWADGPELTALERHVPHPDEHLLRGLGRASRLVPSLGPALAAVAPCAQVTDGAGALAFLRDGAPDPRTGWLRGTCAALVAVLEGTCSSLRLKARSTSRGGSSTTTIGLDGLCDIRWEAVLGDDKLGLAELRELARLKQPLVRIRGQWVELGESDIAAAIAAVGKRRPPTRMSAGEVLRTALGIEPTARRPSHRRSGGGRVARGPPRRCR